MDNETILFVLAVFSYLVTFVTFYRNQKREHDENVKEIQKIKDTLDQHGKLIESHNKYAEMFREYGEDIAFIRGKLENK